MSFPQENFVIFRNPLSESVNIDVNAYHVLNPSEKKVSGLSTTLIALDHFFDLIPFGSTATNLINATQLAMLPKDQNQDSQLKAYHEHLRQKSFAGCALYGVPVIGNVAKIGVSIFQALSPKKEEKPTTDQPFEKGMSTIGRRMGS